MKKFTVFLVLFINHCSAQWYQITLPVSGYVYQMQFVNQNTGWATIYQGSFYYTLIRTTNSGLNWNAIFSDSAKVETFQFINDTLGFGLGQAGNNLLLKTTTVGTTGL
jgi:hypothetical protein